MRKLCKEILQQEYVTCLGNGSGGGYLQGWLTLETGDLQANKPDNRPLKTRTYHQGMRVHPTQRSLMCPAQHGFPKQLDCRWD